MAFGSDFNEPEWQDVYKLKYAKSESDKGLAYLVSHALRGAQMSMAFPFSRVTFWNQESSGNIYTILYTQLSPRYMEGYRETARAVRALGYKCIEKRIKAVQNGEEVPNDILSQIIRTTSTKLSMNKGLMN